MTRNLYCKYKWLVLMVILSPAQATELVHHFESPMNGGSSANGSVFFSQETDQNNFKDPAAVAAAAAAAAASAAANSTTSTAQSNLEAFKNRLQNAILSNLSSNSASTLFDSKGNILTNQNLSFDLNGDGTPDFTVVVGEKINNTIAIKIGDGITETTLTVPYVVKP
jgi:hypothetical protein